MPTSEVEMLAASLSYCKADSRTCWARTALLGSFSSVRWVLRAGFYVAFQLKRLTRAVRKGDFI